MDLSQAEKSAQISVEESLSIDALKPTIIEQK